MWRKNYNFPFIIQISINRRCAVIYKNRKSERDLFVLIDVEHGNVSSCAVPAFVQKNVVLVDYKSASRSRHRVRMHSRHQTKCAQVACDEAYIEREFTSAFDFCSAKEQFAKPYVDIPGPRELPIIGNSWRFAPIIGDYPVTSCSHLLAKTLILLICVDWNSYSQARWS